jgi:hypothetical protein
MPSKNEMIEVNGERRSLRRDEQGRCRLNDELGESVAGHVRQHFLPAGNRHADAIAHAHVSATAGPRPRLRASRGLS